MPATEASEPIKSALTSRCGVIRSQRSASTRVITVTVNTGQVVGAEGTKDPEDEGGTGAPVPRAVPRAAGARGST